MMMTGRQLAARLVFLVGLAVAWFVLGPIAVAGAGLMLLTLIAAREVDASGRKPTEPPHWQADPSHVQPND